MFGKQPKVVAKIEEFSNVDQSVAHISVSITNRTTWKIKIGSAGSL